MSHAAWRSAVRRAASDGCARSMRLDEWRGGDAADAGALPRRAAAAGAAAHALRFATAAPPWIVIADAPLLGPSRAVSLEQSQFRKCTRGGPTIIGRAAPDAHLPCPLVASSRFTCARLGVSPRTGTGSSTCSPTSRACPPPPHVRPPHPPGRERRGRRVGGRGRRRVGLAREKRGGEAPGAGRPRPRRGRAAAGSRGPARGPRAASGRGGRGRARARRPGAHMRPVPHAHPGPHEREGGRRRRRRVVGLRGRHWFVGGEHPHEGQFIGGLKPGIIGIIGGIPMKGVRAVSASRDIADVSFVAGFSASFTWRWVRFADAPRSAIARSVTRIFCVVQLAAAELPKWDLRNGNHHRPSAAEIVASDDAAEPRARRRGDGVDFVGVSVPHLHLLRQRHEARARNPVEAARQPASLEFAGAGQHAGAVADLLHRAVVARADRLARDRSAARLVRALSPRIATLSCGPSRRELG